MLTRSPVHNLEWLADQQRWRGRVRLGNRPHPHTILIFQDGERWLGVSARCPHEGVDLSACPLDDAGRLICPAHGLQVQVTGPESEAFAIDREGDAFWVLEGSGGPV